MSESALEAMVTFERGGRASVHRGLYPLAARASEAYERARQDVARFVGADAEGLVFTKGTTEGLNLVAQGIASQLGPGDEVLVTIADHHASVLPWLALSKEYGFVVRTVGLDEGFRLDLHELKRLLSPRTRVVAVPMISNVLGTRFPIEEIAGMAHEVGAYVIIDAAQAVGHVPIDVEEIGCDALAFSAHKMYGPMGIGALYLGERLCELSPLLFGGGMVDDATELLWKKGVERFEAGTPNVTATVGFAAAANDLRDRTLRDVSVHEAALTKGLIDGLMSQSGVHIVGPRDLHDRSGIVSFTVDGMHAHDLAHILGEQGICVRAGHHCAQPLAQAYCPQGSVRVSIGRGNSVEDIEAFILALEVAKLTLAYV